MQPKPRSQIHPAGQLAGLSVLLVDDVVINQNVMQHILLRAGARIDVAENGQIAVDLLQQAGQHYDAVLMDIQMPVLDGYQATLAIRAMGLIDLPIIAMSANATHEDRQHALAAGMHAHLAKPIDAQQLIATVICSTGRRGPEAGAVAQQDLAQALDQTPHAMSIAGIDVDSALQRFGGHQAALVALLKRFEHSHGDALRETRRLLATGQPQAATQCLHRLRGVAANLGAAQIASLTLQAEAAIETAHDGELTTLLATLLDALDAAMAIVVGAARTLPLPPPQPPQVAPTSAVPLPHALAELLALLQNSNLEALTQFQALRPAIEQTATGPENVLALADAIETLNFTAAEKLVQDMLTQKDSA